MSDPIAAPAETSLVVTQYAQDKGHLIAHCLTPLVDGIQWRYGRDSVYLERHWLRGPHVRIVVTDPGRRSEDGTTLIEELRTEAVPAIEAYLAEHPSTEQITPEEYLARSVELGRSELVLPPYGPLRPDNTVVEEEVPTHNTVALIGAEGYALRQRFLTLAMRPLHLAHQQILAGQHRTVPAMQIMLLHASRWPFGGLESGYLTYKSHLEDFLLLNDQSGTLRESYVRRFEKNRAAYTEVFQQLLAHGKDGVYQGEDAYLAAWSEALDELWEEALELAGRQSIEEDLGPGYRATAEQFDADTERRWRFGDDRDYSEFHQKLRKLNYLPQRTAVTEFAAYRNLTNHLLRWLPMLDVSPVERYFLAHVISELVQEEFGSNWRERLTQDPEQVKAEVAGRIAS